jgi:hypothetical protein
VPVGGLLLDRELNGSSTIGLLLDEVALSLDELSLERPTPWLVEVEF